MTIPEQRLSRVKQAMAADAVDALLVMSPVGSCYLSGCYLMTQMYVPDRQAYVLITSGGQPTYLVCNLEEQMAKHFGWIDDIRTYVEFAEEPVDAACTLLEEKGLTGSRVAIESHRVPQETFAKLKHTLPENTYVPWDERFEQIQMVKDDREIQALEAAGRKAQSAIEKTLYGAESGVTELDLANEMMAILMADGLTPMFAVFGSGPRGALVHAEPIDRSMQPGEILRLDIGGRFPSNYLCDIARTAVIGEPSKIQQENYGKLYRAQESVIEAMVPGTLISELFEICKSSFEAQNIPFRMPHIGHGLGIGLHESPLIHPGNSTRLVEGMVLNIEPLLIVAEREEAYHIEDLVLVTENGPRPLTSPQETLIEVPI